MKFRRLIPLCLWLSTIMMMAAGILVPGAASAHPGHGEERGQRALVVFHAPFDPASLSILDDLAKALLHADEPQAASLSFLATQPDGERDCAGAACCGTSHGCCVAYLTSWDDPSPPPTGNRLAIALAGAPPGRDTSALPEPPRPYR